MSLHRVNVEGVARFPTLSHATIAGEWVFVSGVLGTVGGVPKVVGGGIAAETTQALQNLERILSGCGCGLQDVAKVSVFLVDMASFAEMNKAYLAVFETEPPARITVQCAGLSLGGVIEMDCIAMLPNTPRPA